MRTWVADLSGLVIGFALGGAALVHFLPQIEAYRAAGRRQRRRRRTVHVATVAPLPVVAGPPRFAPPAPGPAPLAGPSPR